MAITAIVYTWSSLHVRVTTHRHHMAAPRPRMPAHAASRAKARAMFSGWKKSRAASWIAAQNGIGADRATAIHADSLRSAGSRARKKRYAVGAVAARPADEKMSSTIGLGQSLSIAARTARISSKWMP